MNAVDSVSSITKFQQSKFCIVCDVIYLCDQLPSLTSSVFYCFSFLHSFSFYVFFFLYSILLNSYLLFVSLFLLLPFKSKLRDMIFLWFCFLWYYSTYKHIQLYCFHYIASILLFLPERVQSFSLQRHHSVILVYFFSSLWVLFCGSISIHINSVFYLKIFLSFAHLL